MLKLLPSPLRRGLAVFDCAAALAHGSTPRGDFLGAIMAQGQSEHWRIVLKHVTGRTFGILGCVFLFIGGAAATVACAANDASSSVTRVADLAWLAGTWRGTTPAGRTIETTYTTPEGGVLLGTSKEYTADGRCTFFDLEHFAMKDGVLTLTPHPAGKRSPDSFPLAAFERTARRATFVNHAHDWPQQFVYERVSEARLVITLSGPDKKGGAHIERFELQLVDGGRRSVGAANSNDGGDEAPSSKAR